MKARLRVGLVGFGEIGQRHFDLINRSEVADVVAVAEPNRDRSQTLESIATFDSLAALLDQVKIDVVVLCSPSGLHADQAALAAQSGVHVITEKPLATSLNDALSMIQVCEQENVQLDVVYQYRHAAGSVRLRQAITNGELGNIIFANSSIFWRRDTPYFEGPSAWRASWEGSGGGALMNQGVHALDLLTWLCGPIIGSTGLIATQREDLGVEDCVSALLEFDSGTLGTVQVTTAASMNEPMEFLFCGTLGSAKLSGGSLEIRRRDGSTEIVEEPETRNTLHARHLDAAFRAIQHGDEVPVTGRAALLSLQTTVAIYESAARSSVIDLRTSELKLA